MTVYTLKKVEAGDKFVSLADTPPSYMNSAGKVLRVNQDETALEFDDEKYLNIARGSHELGEATKLRFRGLKVTEESAGVFTVEGSQPPDSLGNHDVPTWSGDSNDFVPSGLNVSNGIINGAQSLTLGSHTLRGVGDELGYFDEYTGKDYLLVTQDLPTTGKSSPVGIQFTDEATSSWDVSTDESENVDQPEWVLPSRDSNIVIYGIILRDVVTPTNVAKLSCFISNRLVFQESAGNLVAGSNRIDLLSPIVIRQGQHVQFNILEPLDTFTVKGKDGTPAHSLIIRKFNDADLLSTRGLPIKQEAGANPVATAESLVFPSSSVFIGEGGEVIVETGFGVDNAGQDTVGNVVNLSFGDDFSITQQPINGRPNVSSVDISLANKSRETVPSYLAYFGRPTTLFKPATPNSAPALTNLYPEMISVDSGNRECLLPDADNRSFTIKPVVGFTESDYLVTVRLAMRGYASSDGYIKVSLVDSTGIINDHNNNPLIIQHIYKQGDGLGSIQLTGIIKVRNPVTFSIDAVTTITGDYTVICPRDEDASGILIQGLSYLSNTSDALQQFEQDTGERIKFSRRTLGSELLHLDSLFTTNSSPVVATAGSTIKLSNGSMVYAAGNINWSTNGESLILVNDGANVLDYAVGKIFDTGDTSLLKNHIITLQMSFASNHDLVIGVVKWTGAPDKATKLYNTRGATDPTWLPGWSLASKVSVPKGVDPTSFISFGTAIEVPNDAVQFAIVVYPELPAANQSNYLRMFTASPDVIVEGYLLGNPSLVGEPVAKSTTEVINLVQDNQNTGEIRYPINVTASPMPMGVLTTIVNDVVPAPSVNPFSAGSENQRDGEGGLEFVHEGLLNFNQTKLLLVNLTGSAASCTFMYSVKHPDGTFTDITDSETTFNVSGNNGSGQYFKMKSFSYHCRAHDVVFLSSRSTVDGAIYLQSISAGMPMLTTTINYKQLLPTSFDSPQVIESTAFGASQVDTVDTTYAVAAANTPATLPLNTLLTTSNATTSYTLNNATDTVSLGRVGRYWLSYNIHVVKPNTGQTTRYGSWLEYSTNNGATWTYLNGSSYVLVMPTNSTSAPSPISVSFPFETTVANTLIRGRHAASSIADNIGIRSYAATAVFPATSAWRLVGKLI